VKEAELYYMLQIWTNGRFRDRDGTKKFLAKKLKITDNTLCTRLKKLTKVGWIHFNASKNTYYVISHLSIMKSLRLTGVLTVKATIKAFKDFEAFLISILLTEKLNAMTYMNNKKERNVDAVLKANCPGANKVSPRSSFFHVPDYLKLGTHGIKKMLNCSYGKAQALKTRAYKQNFIKVIKHTKPLLGDLSISKAQIAMINKAYPEDQARLKTARYYLRPQTKVRRPCGSYIFMDLCDEIQSKLILVKLNKNTYRKIRPLGRIVKPQLGIQAS